MVKKSELCFGDWFCLSGTEQYFQIDEVYKVQPLRSEKIMVGGIDRNGQKVFYYLDEIDPIPIEGKILVKNGFAVSVQMSKYYLMAKLGGKEISEMTKIVYDVTSGEWIGFFVGPEGVVMNVRVHYVHELQRNLRCVGSDPELEL